MLWNAILWIFFLSMIVLLLGDGGSERDESRRGQVTALSREYLFDYATWEFDALWGKVRQELFGIHPYLDTGDGKTIILDYLQRLAEVQTLERQIDQIYANPEIRDPEAASVEMRHERDRMRHDLAEDQPLVEGILEEQVSAVLIEEGFGVLGQVLPPVSMHFTELPALLVISPRDHIEFAVDLTLVNLTVEEREALERRIESKLDVSALVVPLGGISLYPSMVVETSYLPRAIEVTAHEWSHHYLSFYPLGLEYTAQPETRLINETVADFFGKAVALKVMQRYYPEMPQPDYSLQTFEPPAPVEITGDPDALPLFDYGREMNEIRVTVDFLLSQGWITQAETYMEYRRREFVRNGYSIRRMNQAYFAFYGGYQGEPGAGGSDPIGPAIQALLNKGDDLQDYLQTARSITTRDELLAAAD
jgi:hypothetical protein